MVILLEGYRSGETYYVLFDMKSIFKSKVKLFRKQFIFSITFLVLDLPATKPAALLRYISWIKTRILLKN